jgi:hypothetical protein
MTYISQPRTLVAVHTQSVKKDSLMFKLINRPNKYIKRYRYINTELRNAVVKTYHRTYLLLTTYSMM